MIATTLGKVAIARHNRLLDRYADTFERADGPLGYPWIAPSWAIVSGRAVGTPAAGAELLTDTSLEANYTAGLCDSLAKIGGVVAQSADVHGGAKAQEFTATAAGDCVYVNTGAPQVGTWHRFTAWGKRLAGVIGNNRILVFQSGAGGLGIVSGEPIASGVYAQRVMTVRPLTVANMNVYAAYTSYGGPVYDTVVVDDQSLVRLTTSSLLAGIPFAHNNMDVSAPLIRAANCQAGVVLCADSITNPLNLVTAYADGLGNVKLDKMVNGVWAPVASVAVTYGNDKVLRCKQLGTSFSFYYDGAQLGTTQTIGDTGIINNKICGVFSTHSGNSFASFSAVPS